MAPQTNVSKTDSLLSQHAGKSLDELVAQKIINSDQRAQVMKKPALQVQLAQMEEQLVQYQKVHEQYRSRAMSDKAEWEKSLDKAKADAVGEVKQEFKKSLQENLLVLSQFLRLAAYRREETKDPEADESQAIEGVLLAIYAGDETAVASMLKLIEGSEEQILSVPGDQLQTTCWFPFPFAPCCWAMADLKQTPTSRHLRENTKLPSTLTLRRLPSRSPQRN